MIIKKFNTDRGIVFHGKCEDFFQSEYASLYEGKVNLIFTSPPFPLNRAKKYGNAVGEEYVEWLSKIAEQLEKFLTDDGSIVIEIGNAWEPSHPVQSTLPMESLLALKKAANLYLCQEFIFYNPAKLPAPIEYVNKKRIRVKDSFTRIWWLSKTAYPKANNRNVLESYSKQMKKLIKSGKYNAGIRPSEHNIGTKSFIKDNGGSIPGNVIIASNTVSNDIYLRYCKNNNIEIHPARMPKEIPEFFIRLLTDEEDIVMDPFAGSNITGAIAEDLSRKWISIETNTEYIRGSEGRFCK